MKRIWKAKTNCQMPWKDFSKGDTCELDDEQVTPRVKALFEVVKEEKEEKKESSDMKVMLSRLKAAKIPVKRGAKEEDVKALFDTFLAKGNCASEIAKSVRL